MIIIKIGGGKKTNWGAIISDIIELSKTDQVLVVHGANQIRDEVAEKMGKPTKVITSPSGISSVYTNDDAIDMMLMSYAGLVNKRIVAHMQKAGLNAVGLTGIDGRLWEGKRKEKVLVKEGEKTKLVKDNLTGRVEKVNTDLILLLLNNGYIPVITAPAISYEGDVINMDNDLAIAVMAGELKTDKLILLFDAPGLLKDHKNENSLIDKVSQDQMDEILEYASGRMKKKVLGAQKALEAGVKTIYWGDARIENPVTNALAGKGTTIS